MDFLNPSNSAVSRQWAVGPTARFALKPTAAARKNPHRPHQLIPMLFS